MPDTFEAKTQSRGFPCAQCGAGLVFSAGSTHLQCPYCGHVNEIAATAATTAIVEHDLRELSLMPATENRGFGIETRNFKCSQCGATTSFSAGMTSTKCAFCGSEIVVQTPSNPNLVRPETLIPFLIDKPNAVQKFRGWLGGLWFRPNNLKKMAAVADISGVYTPFFTFDAHANSQWTGEAGFYYYEQESYYDNEAKEWRTRQVQRVRWEWRGGQHFAIYDDELVCASRGMPQTLVQRIEPFQLSELKPYKEEFLSGWSAEEYSIDPKESWMMAQETMRQQEIHACSALLGGDTQRNLSVQTQFSDITWKHALLPVYIAAYRYGSKLYHFLVNGQTGEVSGESPLSWWKIAALVAAILMIVAGIYLMTGHR